MGYDGFWTWNNCGECEDMLRPKVKQQCINYREVESETKLDDLSMNSTMNIKSYGWQK